MARGQRSSAARLSKIDVDRKWLTCGQLDAYDPFSELGPSPAAARYALVRGAGSETHGGYMYIVIRKYTKVRSVADAARRAKSGIGQILRKSHGFRSYYVLDGGEGIGVAVMIFENRESAHAANDKVLEFKQACMTLILVARNHRRGSFDEYRI